MPTLTSMSTLTVSGSSSSWQATASFDRPAEAMAFAARFPNSAGLKVDGANATSSGTLANGTAGVRRYRSLIARAQQLRVTIEWQDPSGQPGALVSQVTFDAAVFGTACN